MAGQNANPGPCDSKPMTKGTGVLLTSPLLAGEPQASCSTSLILRLLISKLWRVTVPSQRVAVRGNEITQQTPEFFNEYRW